MFLKVIIITIITMSTADRRMLLSEILGGQDVASPALTYKRHDIFPMIFKYAEVEEYSAPSSKSRSVRSANSMFQTLQYAPLRAGMRDYIDPRPTHSSTSEETTRFSQLKNSRQYGKSHLEPRTDATDNKCYAPEYQLRSKSSTIRSPGHNAVYRIISETDLEEKPITAYDKPIGINLDLKSLISATNIPIIDFASDSKNKPLSLTEEHFVRSPNSIETVHPVQEKSKRYSSYPKYHRLHLNIARVYSPGQVLPKPPAYAHAYPDHYDKPPKPKPYMPQAFQDRSKNTLLFPVKHHRKGKYHSGTSMVHF